MADALKRVTRLSVRGKFFFRDGERVSISAVTYGPFPRPVPEHHTEFSKIVKAGFNAIRIYEEPSERLMLAALQNGLMVFAGVHWQWTRVFRGGECERYFVEAKLRLSRMLDKWRDHEALVGFYVANEIPTDIARWIGPVKVKQSLEELIDFCRALAPQVLIGYSNYPTSEYLEPSNADFTGFNIYLEERQKLAEYLPRLHHIAGDRPVLISEFGVDAASRGVEAQREILMWARQEMLNAGLAGMTLFAWSDKWRIGEREISEWEFGLTDIHGEEKFTLSELHELRVSEIEEPMVSVIICVFNGADRISSVIESLDPKVVRYANYEVIIVDDGSTDETREIVRRYEFVNLVCADHGGLSKARNLGAEAASGEIFAYTDDDCEVDSEWLNWIARGYAEQGVDAMGGPNIPPEPSFQDEAVVAAAPGAPSHVMLNDMEAEHIPGCNLTVKREAFEAIGGFREVYRVAGDDVDFCWRLEKAGFRIGFHGAAFVWHRRRTLLNQYFRQQKGYGKAEALLMRDHPEKFTRNAGVDWKGCVYTGASLGVHNGSVIYHGSLATGAYQQVVTTMMPRRLIHPSFDTFFARCKLGVAEFLQPRIRRWCRWWYSREWRDLVKKMDMSKPSQEARRDVSVSEATVEISSANLRMQFLRDLLDSGWTMDCDFQSWDLSCSDGRLLLVLEVLGDEHFQLKLRVASDLGGETSGQLLDDIVRKMGIKKN